MQACNLTGITDLNVMVMERRSLPIAENGKTEHGFEFWRKLVEVNEPKAEYAGGGPSG